MKQLLVNLFDKSKIEYTQEAINKLCSFYDMVIEENKKINLTAITEKNDFAIKHILDCALVCNLIKKDQMLIDIGAGAGFPSIVLKILRPDIKITMIDALNKRINFLNNVIDKLKLSDIYAIHTRAEDFALNNRERFDYAIARAVAGLNTLCEYCLPFVKVGGEFIAMKSSNYSKELSDAENSLFILGGKCESIQNVTIKEQDTQRYNIVIKKIKTTPNIYPRGKNLPRIKPL